MENRATRGLFEPDPQDVQDVVDIAQVSPHAAAGRAGLRATAHLGSEIIEPAITPIVDAAGDANLAVREFTGTTPVYAVAQGLIKKGLESTAETLSDTSAGKWVLDQLEQNPAAARDMIAGIESMDVLALRRAGGPALNNFLDEMITKLEGFYSRDPGAKVTSFAREGAKGLPNYLEGLLSPQAIANRREKGAGQTRVDEFTSASQSDSVGNLLATNAISRQRPESVRDNSLTSVGPTVLVENKYETTWGDPEGVKWIIGSEAPDMPDAAREFFYRQLERGVDPTPPSMLNPKARARWELRNAPGRITNVTGTDPQKTIIIGRNPNGPRSGSVLAHEAMGTKSTGSTVVRRIRDGSMEKHFQDLGIDNPTPEQYANYLNKLTVFEGDSLHRMNQALGRGDTRKTSELVKAKVKEKVTRRQDDYSPELDAFTPKKAHNEYWAAAAKKPEDRTPEETKLVNYVDGAAGNKVQYDKDTNSLRYNFSYHSEAKDLGGVGGSMYVDLGSGKMYTNIIDGHDMFGADPAGGVNLWHMLPAMEMPFGGGRVEFPTKGDRELELEAQGVENLKQRTGMEPLGAETAEQHRQRAAAAGARPKRERESDSDFWKRAEAEGGPRLKKESADEFYARAEELGLPRLPGEKKGDYTKRLKAQGVKRRMTDEGPKAYAERTGVEPQQAAESATKWRQEIGIPLRNAESPGMFERRVHKEWNAPVRTEDYVDSLINTGMLGTLLTEQQQEQQ